RVGVRRAVRAVGLLARVAGRAAAQLPLVRGRQRAVSALAQLVVGPALVLVHEPGCGLLGGRGTAPADTAVAVAGNLAALAVIEAFPLGHPVADLLTGGHAALGVRRQDGDDGPALC